jgi:hypothetical protein
MKRHNFIIVKTEGDYHPTISLIKLLWSLGIIKEYICFYAAENETQMIQVWCYDN